MQRFAHDGVDIAFLDEGAGAPIVLVHGFASTAQVNWRHPGWVGTLTGAGRRVIALDNRGHGGSSKLYDPAAYRPRISRIQRLIPDTHLFQLRLVDQAANDAWSHRPGQFVELSS